MSDELDVSEKKIYCANCENCKVVRQALGNGGEYQLRVRCAAGQWNKKSGEEKLYKYFTLPRRSMDACAFYESMGDSKLFLKKLRANLPTKDEVYVK